MQHPLHPAPIATAGRVGRSLEKSLLAGMKAKHFSERTLEELSRLIEGVAGAAAVDGSDRHSHANTST